MELVLIISNHNIAQLKMLRQENLSITELH